MDEYYLTRSEFEILQREALNIAENSDPKTFIFELGSGSSYKTRALIDAFIKTHGVCNYVPIDISESILMMASQQLSEEYPKTRIYALHATYEQALKFIEKDFKNVKKLIVLLGSNIGNMLIVEAVEFIKNIRYCKKAIYLFLNIFLGINDGDEFLIGMDLKKEASVLLPAYDDSKKVTASFYYNLIDRMNRELSANINPKKFDYLCVWNENSEEEVARIEMSMRSNANQTSFLNLIPI